MKIVVVWVVVVGLMRSFAPAATPAATAPAPAPVSYTRQQDVIYGRYFGTALTMDVFTPTEKPNHAAVVFVCSGGWISNHDAINFASIGLFIRPFLDHGYTVFAVVHPSQPRFNIEEIAPQIDRAVRFIRASSNRFKIDGDRIAIYGGSAGGHLSLLQATNPSPGKVFSLDPVERASGKVQVVGVFFPPTDFLNWDGPDHTITKGAQLGPFRAAFDFRHRDPRTNRLEELSDEENLSILRDLSPIDHVSADAPPTLIIHGDADALVPLQQSQRFAEAMKHAGATCELIVRHGRGHGWLNAQPDLERIVKWFDAHLLKQPAAATTQP